MHTVHRILRPIYAPIYNALYRQFRAPKRYHHLFDEIKRVQAKRILEVGVWNGDRAVQMLTEAFKYNQQIDYYGFDLFEDLGQKGYVEELSKMPPSESEVRTLLEQTGAKVYLYKGNTLHTLPDAVRTLPKMNFVFIDGGHSVETIASDWENITKLMDDTTVVIFDDYWRNRTDAGCKTVVDGIDPAQYKVEILPEIDSFNNPDFGRLDISFAKVTKWKK